MKIGIKTIKGKSDLVEGELDGSFDPPNIIAMIRNTIPIKRRKAVIIIWYIFIELDPLEIYKRPKHSLCNNMDFNIIKK